VEQLAETLIALLRDPARLQSYGIAGRRWVEERYTWPRVVDRLVAALDGPV
jgi:glycosyltransferase involved in cell wall biosynthesis